MSQAYRIRQAAPEKYIQPARAAGQEDIIIRASDLHDEMKLRSLQRAGQRQIRSIFGVRRLEITGPVNRANVYFHFELIQRGWHDSHDAAEKRLPSTTTEPELLS